MFNLLIIILISLILINAILVVSVYNPVHSILYLILVFFSGSLLLLLMQIDFLGFLFLIIYVGAILVSFLFVLMMLNLRYIDLKRYIFSYMPFGILIILFFIFEFFFFQISFLLLNFEFNINVIYINFLNYLRFDLTSGHLFGLYLYNYLYIHLFFLTYILVIITISIILLTYLSFSIFNIKQNKVVHYLQATSSQYYINTEKRLLFNIIDK